MTKRMFFLVLASLVGFTAWAGAPAPDSRGWLRLEPEGEHPFFLDVEIYTIKEVGEHGYTAWIRHDFKDRRPCNGALCSSRELYLEEYDCSGKRVRQLDLVRRSVRTFGDPELGSYDPFGTAEFKKEGEVTTTDRAEIKPGSIDDTVHEYVCLLYPIIKDEVLKQRE